MKRQQKMRAALGGIDPDEVENDGRQFNDPEEVSRRERNATILEALKRIYNAKIRPLEQAFKFAEFYNSELSEGDFDSRPMVLLIGQYSVGKTSFIKYLIGRDFPGQRIGPEPTTDRFVAVMRGKQDRIVPGNAAAVDPQRPFSSLGRFGTAFLNRFEIAELSAPIMDALYLVDTPGILSGEKQRLDRGYNFEEVVQWFAERADRILLLFDAHKLDISDELKRTIHVLKPHEEKIRIVLNKADLIDSQQLMRVYGALMWSLGKVVKTPEVIRVYLGSFWDKPLAETGKSNSDLFSAEQEDLISDLRSLPRNAAVRKVNELVKRARLCKVHSLLISHLRSNMPYLWGHQKKQKKLVGRLEEEYRKVAKMHDLAPGDFPPIEKFRTGLERFDISEFPSLNSRLVDICDVALTKDVPNLILQMQGMELKAAATSSGKDSGTSSGKLLSTGAQRGSSAARQNSGDGRSDRNGSSRKQGFYDAEDLVEDVVSWDVEEKADNPFSGKDDAEDDDWVVDEEDRIRHENTFYRLGPSGHPPTVNGGQARSVMLESGVPMDCLRKIWDLVDFESSGALDIEEFALAMHLIEMAKLDGPKAVPTTLPRTFVPPSKR